MGHDCTPIRGILAPVVREYLAPRWTAKMLWRALERLAAVWLAGRAGRRYRLRPRTLGRRLAYQSRHRLLRLSEQSARHRRSASNSLTCYVALHPKHSVTASGAPPRKGPNRISDQLSAIQRQNGASDSDNQPRPAKQDMPPYRAIYGGSSCFLKLPADLIKTARTAAKAKRMARPITRRRNRSRLARCYGSLHETRRANRCRHFDGFLVSGLWRRRRSPSNLRVHPHRDPSAELLDHRLPLRAIGNPRHLSR